MRRASLLALAFIFVFPLSVHGSGIFNQNGNGGGGQMGYTQIQDETVNLAAENTVNFTGAGVTCVDNAGEAATYCTIPGGGSTTFDLIGTGANTTGAMTCGTGCSMLTAGTGTIAATTAAALAANPTDCAANQYAKAIDASGNLTCEQVTKATALAANGANCAANQAAGGVDASGAAESCIAPVLTAAGDSGTASPSAGVLTVTGGAGIITSGASSAITVATASSEQGFLASGALTCGAATNGEMQVHTTPLQYCDNAATPTLRYAAYGSSTGVATSATALAANGTNCSAGSFPLGVDASGNAESCTTLASSNAGTATALAANGTNCSAGSFPLGVDASGNAESCTTLSSVNAGTATALAADGANCSANQAAGGVDASGAAQSCIAPLILAGISGGQSALGSTASATSTTETLTLAANAATGSAIAGQGNLTPIIVNSPLSLFPTGTLTVGTGGGNNALITLDPTVTMAGTTQFYGIDFSPTVTVVAAGEVVQGLHAAATVGTTVSNTSAWQLFADSSIYTQTAAAKAPTLRTFSDGGTTACNFAGTCTTATLIPSAFKNAHLYWAEGGSAVWQVSPTLNGTYGFWDNPVFKADSGSTLTSSRYGVQIDDVAVQGTGTVTVPNDIGVNCSDLTAGSTTDVCLQSAVTSGTGKFGINAQGTAQNRLLGNTIIGGTTSTTPAGTLNVQEPTAVTNTTPNEAFRVESNSAAGDFPNTKIFQSRGTAAAGATQTMDLGLSTADHEYLVEARVICHCTSGATCATTVRGGAAILVGTFVNVAGTVTQIGPTTSVHSQISLTLTSITLTASTPNARVTFISAAAAANTCHVTWLESDVGS